jgi:hypothetical protein
VLFLRSSLEKSGLVRNFPARNISINISITIFLTKKRREYRFSVKYILFDIFY